MHREVIRSLRRAAYIVAFFAAWGGLVETHAATWGVNSDWNICQWTDRAPCFVGPESYEKIRAAGVRHVRLTLYWFNVEPEPGVYDWRFPDGEINAVTAAGLDVYVSILFPPRWAAGGSPAYDPFYCTATNPDPVCVDPPPIDVAAFRSFVRAAVTRYKDRVHLWGFSNEPGYGEFWPSQNLDWLIDQVLRPGYEEAKGVDPSAFVVGPEADDAGNLGYLLREEQTRGPLFDILSFHGYDWKQGYPEVALERITEFLAVAAPYRDGRPIWLTETGPSLAVYSFPEAAKRLGQFMDISLAMPFERIYIYRIRSGGTSSTDFGLLDQYNSPTPAYDAVRARLVARRRAIRRGVAYHYEVTGAGLETRLTLVLERPSWLRSPAHLLVNRSGLLTGLTVADEAVIAIPLRLACWGGTPPVRIDAYPVDGRAYLPENVLWSLTAQPYGTGQPVCPGW